MRNSLVWSHPTTSKAIALVARPLQRSSTRSTGSRRPGRSGDGAECQNTYATRLSSPILSYENAPADRPSVDSLAPSTPRLQRKPANKELEPNPTRNLDHSTRNLDQIQQTT